MTITPRAPQPTLQLPLPLYDSVVIADAVSRDGDQFQLVVGLDQQQAVQLKQRSLDETDTELQANSSDRIRFGEQSYEDWYAKDRTPFALIHQPTQTLAAMTFLGPKTFISASPEDTVTNWHTLGYRSYVPWRGTGIMKTFVGFAIGFYLEHYPTAQLWTGIHADNAASQGLATALGFTINEAASDREHDFLVMVRR